MAAFNGVVEAEKLPAPSYGLLSVAHVHNHGAGDDHWVGGYYVETEACGTTTQGQPLCYATDPSLYNIFDGTGSDRFFHVSPFGIVETYECDNSIGYNAVDRRASVVKSLERVSEYAVEQELWLGTSAQLDADALAPATRWLIAADDVTPTAGTAVKPKLAIALVEQAFASANPGLQATIHVTPLIAGLLNGYFVEDGDQLLTPNGSLVAISRGGEGDVGPAAGGSDTKHWVYATGQVHVDLGSEELITTSASEIVNPRDNSVIYTAERPAAVYFDGCAWFGALADATL